MTLVAGKCQQSNFLSAMLDILSIIYISKELVKFILLAKFQLSLSLHYNFNIHNLQSS